MDAHIPILFRPFLTTWPQAACLTSLCLSFFILKWEQ